MRFTSDALQALIKGQVGKEFYPLPGMPHIGEAETFTSRVFEPSKSAFEHSDIALSEGHRYVAQK